MSKKIKKSSKVKKKNISKSDIEKALKEVMDPELGINIVDLGLIYGIEIKDNTVHVKMTLTFSGCPLAGYIAGQVKEKLESLPEVKKSIVELVWDPPWTPKRVRKEIKEKLGL